MSERVVVSTLGVISVCASAFFVWAAPGAAQQDDGLHDYADRDGEVFGLSYRTGCRPGAGDGLARADDARADLRGTDVGPDGADRGRPGPERRAASRHSGLYFGASYGLRGPFRGGHDESVHVWGAGFGDAGSAVAGMERGLQELEVPARSGAEGGSAGAIWSSSGRSGCRAPRGCADSRRWPAGGCSSPATPRWCTRLTRERGAFTGRSMPWGPS